MQVDFDRLSRYHEDGKLRHSVHPDRNLHVWCYSQSTVYNRDWDDLTRLCRGLVTDSEGNVASRPFPKFFNWGEPGAPDDVTKPFIAYDKMDGSLIVVGRDTHGDRVVSTKGSFTTWHSERATELLGTYVPPVGTTVLFEFIDPGNRIVVDYGGFSGLYLLGGVENETGADHFTPDEIAEGTNWFGEVTVSRNFKLQHMLITVQDPENGPNKEGFVLVYPNHGLDSEPGPSERVKIKFAQYVQLHHTLSRLSNVSIWEALRSGMFEALLDVVPDEMYDKVREYSTEITAEVDGLLTEARELAVVAKVGRTLRSEQAEFVKANAENTSLVFNLLDGKEDQARAKAYDIVRPTLDQAWTFLK